MTIAFHPLDPDYVTHIRAGGPDANGQPAERAISSGSGTPCRCCLRIVPEGAPYLIFAARPFDALHPYAETGPAFLCAEECEPWAGQGTPPVLDASPDYLVKAYSSEERIVSGTGQITPRAEVADYAERLLAQEGVAFVDVRSARNNCWLTRAVQG